MLSKKRQRNHSNRKRTTTSTNVSLSQVQDHSKTNFQTNKYHLRSQPVKITHHRNPSKKICNTNNKKSHHKEKSTIKQEVNSTIESTIGINTRSQTPMITRSKSNRIKNWKQKYNKKYI